MDDDIVVDVEHEAGPSNAASSSAVDPASSGTQPEARHSSRLRTISASTRPIIDTAERTTRSGNTRNKPAPKLKLKLSEKAAAQAPGMSFLGQYDRELDSDEEDIAFEEQFILRMPAGEDCDKLRKMVSAREVSNDVWFKFKGAYNFQREGVIS